MPPISTQINAPDAPMLTADAPLSIFVACPICGKLIDVDHYLAQRACGDFVQASPSGGLNATRSLRGMADGLTLAFGVALQPVINIQEELDRR